MASCHVPSAGRVRVTFETTGKVSDVTVTNEELAPGVVACLKRVYGAVVVPPFGPSQVIVLKSFEPPAK